MKGCRMTEPEKKKLGRPRKLPSAVVPIQVYVTPEQHEWLMNNRESASEVIRQLIAKAMEEASNND